MQPSIHVDEVRKFSHLAAHWWDEAGVHRLLHEMNPARIGFIQETLGGCVKDLKILDVACGGGLVCEPLSRLGATVTGIDADANAIDVATAHAQAMGLNITYGVHAAEDFAAKGMTFDAVLALEIIEHVADVSSFLKACLTLLKPQGILILSTLNRTLKSYGLAIVGAEYLLRWVPRGTHDWHKFITPAELAQHLRPLGVTVTHIQGLTYNPLARTWSLKQDTDVNYFLVGRKD